MTMLLPKIERLTSEHNTKPRRGGIEYIAVHYTAGWDSSPGKAADNARYYAITSEQASADFFVDEGGIVQYNPAPEKRYCWAVGGKEADTSQGGGSLFGIAKNANTVSVEMCSRNAKGKPPTPKGWDANDPGYSISPPVIAHAVVLVRYLMAEWDIPMGHLCRHFDVTGKLCPGVMGWNDASSDTANWEAFKTMVAQPTVPVERFNMVAELPDWAKPTIRKLCDYGYLRGGETVYDVNGRPADLDLSMDMIRVMVMNDRAGVYG